DRIRNGEEIPLSKFHEGEDEITRQIIEYGGLFPFNVARLQGKVNVPALDTPKRAMTLAEKIFARQFVADAANGRIGVPAVKPGDAGFAAVDLRFSHEYVTPMAADFFHRYAGDEARVNDPKTIVFFRDHLTFLGDVMTPERIKEGLLDVALQLKKMQEDFAAEQGITLHGELAGGHGSEAICHSKVLQDYALPGQLIIGSDSHTPHSGAIGCVAFGVGTTDVFNSWITKDVRVRVPEEILRHPFVKSGQAIGKILEYCGSAVEELSIDERATMTNMAAEVGAFTGIVAPDAKAVDFLVATRGLDRKAAQAMLDGLFSDPDAEYAEIIEIDAQNMRPLVATPGDPGNGMYIHELPARVKVDIAYAGSCTAGKKDDMDMYARVLREGLEQGRTVHPDVRFYIQFGSQEVKRYCEAKGYMPIFQAVGAQVIEPSCGACINAGPGVSRTVNEVTVSAINRNFPGRSGPGQMYLASPLTVAASALAGYITEYTPRVAAPTVA
ncbi:MAG: 3-isopropylmalate/(R)-2-methylmalate dehydratase large subunit, partial [bacterium]